jgi:hypothetical protein
MIWSCNFLQCYGLEFRIGFSEWISTRGFLIQEPIEAEG